MRLFESERKRSLETKRNMEQFLAQIVDGDPVPTLVINAQHEVTRWNKACALVSGVPAEEMIGTNPHPVGVLPQRAAVDGGPGDECRHGCAGNTVQGHVPPLAVHPGAFEAESFFPQFGENGRWLYFTAAPLRDPAGQIVGAIETLPS